MSVVDYPPHLAEKVGSKNMCTLSFVGHGLPSTPGIKGCHKEHCFPLSPVRLLAAKLGKKSIINPSPPYFFVFPLCILLKMPKLKYVKCGFSSVSASKSRHNAGEPWCADTSHVSNRQDPDFFREISGSEKSLSDAAAAGALTSEAKIINILEFFGPLESPLQELATVDGTSIWAGNGVHLTSNATRVAATRLMKNIAGGSETQEPATKRARLESVIPVRASPSPAAKAAQPTPPPAPKPVPPPLWLSGHLPTNQRGSNNQRGQPRGGWAAKLREEASRRPGEGPTPAQAAGADGADGRARHERVLVPLFYFSSWWTENCDTDSVRKTKESEANWCN